MRKPGRCCSVPSRQTSFNGAATLSLRKLANSSGKISCKSLLQWGRNFIVAETIHITYHILGMSELQWGRNFIVAETTSRCPTCSSAWTRFNGAATLSLRKHCVWWSERRKSPRLQWGRNFIVAETIPYVASVPPGGNASMGPQLYRCGNGLVPVVHHVVILRFNGAATLSLRKRTGSIPLNNAISSFNGAATLSLRKHPTSQFARISNMTASMGPQLYRCGN